MASSLYLSHTQKWRRQRSASRDQYHDALYKKNVDTKSLLTQSNKLPYSVSDTNIASETLTRSCSSSSRSILRSSTTGDLLERTQHENWKGIKKNDRKRKLRFNNSVSVVLIPTLEEYRSAKYDTILWWDTESYREFKQSAVSELQTFICEHSLDIRKAMEWMYQPNTDNIPGYELNTKTVPKEIEYGEEKHQTEDELILVVT